MYIYICIVYVYIYIHVCLYCIPLYSHLVLVLYCLLVRFKTCMCLASFKWCLVFKHGSQLQLPPRQFQAFDFPTAKLEVWHFGRLQKVGPSRAALTLSRPHQLQICLWSDCPHEIHRFEAVAVAPGAQGYGYTLRRCLRRFEAALLQCRVKHNSPD